MGIHYPLGYVGYEAAMLHTFIDLMDNFCSGCHTNDDVDNDCKKCPMGQLAYTAKDYLLNAHESDICTDEATLLKFIKVEIKPLEPHPHFNMNFIMQEKRNPDQLIRLREFLLDLQFMNDTRLQDFRLREQILGREMTRKLSTTKKKNLKKFGNLLKKK